MRPDRAARHALRLIAITACLSTPGAAWARQSARLDATLSPERLGSSTTVGFAFQIATAPGTVPPPLTAMQLSYPFGLGFDLSELGLAICSTQTLETFGPHGCPANSLMGHGTAGAEIQVGPSILNETAQVTAVRTTDNNGLLALLIYASGETPVDAQIIFPATLFPAPPPYGGRLGMTIPLVPSLPGAPDVAVVGLHVTLGPAGLTYYRRVHGHRLAYQPTGVLLPDTCPHGGFPFAATFAFQNGMRTYARTSVPCPRHAS
ncbi:MAG TPA: hypothetical protein VK790_04370 [Solirubrobacteraceae bacterium]|nr:hypothetical protein [Solirubrobacteraceae bacterium]